MVLQLSALGCGATLAEQITTAVTAMTNHHNRITQDLKNDKLVADGSFKVHQFNGNKMIKYYNEKKCLANALISASMRQAKEPKANKAKG